MAVCTAIAATLEQSMAFLDLQKRTSNSYSESVTPLDETALPSSIGSSSQLRSTHATATSELEAVLILANAVICGFGAPCFTAPDAASCGHIAHETVSHDLEIVRILADAARGQSATPISGQQVHTAPDSDAGRGFHGGAVSAHAPVPPVHPAAAHKARLQQAELAVADAPLSPLQILAAVSASETLPPTNFDPDARRGNDPTRLQQSPGRCPASPLRPSCPQPARGCGARFPAAASLWSIGAIADGREGGGSRAGRPSAPLQGSPYGPAPDAGAGANDSGRRDEPLGPLPAATGFGDASRRGRNGGGGGWGAAQPARGGTVLRYTVDGSGRLASVALVPARAATSG